MKNEIMELVSGRVIEEEAPLSLADLCRCCALPAEQIMDMIEQGIVDPIDATVMVSRWQFRGDSVVRIQTALRLQRDLNLNTEGAVLALELMDEIKQLRQTVAYLQRRYL